MKDNKQIYVKTIVGKLLPPWINAVKLNKALWKHRAEIAQSV
jgi:hypothetical protein